VRAVLLALAFAVFSAGYSANSAFAWTILHLENDGKLETAYIKCDNGKQIALHRWIYPKATKYQRLWVKSSSVSQTWMGNCSNNGHYQLGAKASDICGCLGSN